ncbi:hypothetical protein B7P43_G17820 [Cryptotermes secundus]|uniref:Uncharacterized protein n=1 Tax=Cryptotermes secundus TaxID=105785 RepID=A0A2J7R482_9NEOP|nr:uncharacterized protein LOC111863484 isoform X1 [Cryptotermes secundus]PNF35652.1 hypothetical protein B7P43_G17820 [Cryptotermes secundus]
MFLTLLILPMVEYLVAVGHHSQEQDSLQYHGHLHYRMILGVSYQDSDHFQHVTLPSVHLDKHQGSPISGEVGNHRQEQDTLKEDFHNRCLGQIWICVTQDAGINFFSLQPVVPAQGSLVLQGSPISGEVGHHSQKQDTLKEDFHNGCLGQIWICVTQDAGINFFSLQPVVLAQGCLVLLHVSLEHQTMEGHV